MRVYVPLIVLCAASAASAAGCGKPREVAPGVKSEPAPSKTLPRAHASVQTVAEAKPRVIRGSFKDLTLAGFEARAKKAGWRVSNSADWSNEHEHGLRLSLEKRDSYTDAVLLDMKPASKSSDNTVAIAVGETSFILLTLDLDVHEAKPNAKTELAKLAKRCPIDECDRERMTEAVSGMGWKVRNTDFKNGEGAEGLDEDVLSLKAERRKGFGYLEVERRDFAKLAEKETVARDGLAFMTVEFCKECGDKLSRHAKLLEQLASSDRR